MSDDPVFEAMKTQAPQGGFPQDQESIEITLVVSSEKPSAVIDLANQHHFKYADRKQNQKGTYITLTRVFSHRRQASMALEAVKEALVSVSKAGETTYRTVLVLEEGSC